MNFRYRLMRFMAGRYGTDELTFALLILSAVIAIVNIFVRFFSYEIWAILQLLVYAIIGLALFRTLSRNSQARIRENRFFKEKLNIFKNKTEIYRQRKNDKSHVYKKCPKCKAVLRLPYRIGEHTTVCPRCGKEFKVKVRK